MVDDVASRYKEAEPLTSKTAAEVANALSRIYRRGPLKWSKLLQADPGWEFMDVVSQVLAKHGVSVRRGRVALHRDQGIVERWNRTLSERLFGHQYAQEMRLPSGQRSTKWVAWLPGVVAALNGEVTRLTAKNPLMPSKPRRCAAAYKSPPPRFLVVLLVSRSRSSLLGLAFASFTSLESWKVVVVALQTLCGLLRCTGRDARWPSPTSPCCITCRMGRHVALSGKNFLWYPRHPTTARCGSQVLNSSSISVSARQPAGIESLCP